MQFCANVGNICAVGVLDSETNPYGLTTSYLYDSWFKKTRTTNYLGKYITYGYLRQTEKTKITATGDSDGSYSEELFDDLGRKIQTGVKDIQNNMSYKNFVYDIYDRNYSVSEPHTGTSSLWNTTTYDVYGRPITATASTGKVVTMLYDKLTTTETDSTTGKTKTATKNALGNVITLVETPGGTINYSYFANGNVKETNYAGNKITISQDGWGRKTSLVDPSAGTYTYEYNELGENTKETTPNGTTTYVLEHSTGKPNSKTIVGTNTNSSTVYIYNTLPDNKLLKKTVFTDLGNANKTIAIDYTYDAYKRLRSSVETNGYGAAFTKTIDYDAWGRVDIETQTATLNAGSKISTIKTQNEYKNGFAYKIKDYPFTKTLWETSEVNARGQLTKATLGNGIVIDNTYNSNGYVTNMKHTLATATIMELGTDFDIQRGNLNWRKNSLFGNVQENFGYDTQDRLTTYPNALGVQVTQTYEDDGRIKTNTLGTYNYANTAKKYQNTSVTLTPEATGYYGNREGVFDDSMEERNGWDNTGMLTWAVTEQTTVVYDDLKVHSGKYSLKIINPGSIEKVIHANKWIPINNTVATQYTYSAWVYSDNPSADLFLFMKTATETGYFTLVSSVSTSVKNQWIKIEETFLVPANIKKLNIRLDNNRLGNVWFDDVKIRKTTNAALANTVVPDASYRDHQLNVTYNTFKSPYQIEETGKDKISFTYNDNNNRSVMFYGSLDTDKNLRPNRKHYSADGSMEIKENILTGEIEFVTYIGGDGYSAPIVYKKNYDAAGATQDQMLYLHRDYQGSILAITNQVGVILEKRQFDAWGTIIQVQDGAGNNLNVLTILDRGYTGHEHLQSVGLIHMNGRLYDPKLHRFLQPDNYVQDSSNTQNYNRYGYCWNNPLKYTDPSGEFIWVPIIIGAIIGAAAGGAGYVASAIQTGNWNWGQFGLSVLGGAIIGGITGWAAPMSVIGASIGQSMATAFIGGLMPAYGVQVGDWSFSISPSIAFGNTAGIGASLSVTYSAGDFSFSAGVGIMSNSNYNGLGKNGMEIRKSILASYDDGKNGVSLGANSWSGTGGMQEFSQRTGVLGIHSGDFRAMYENDGGPGLNKLGDANDSYRTAALNLSVGKFSAGFNLFTGARSTGDQKKEDKRYGFVDSMGVYHQNPATNEQGTKYRLGALTVGYGGYRVGVNSEHVRHAIQNAVIHRMIGDNEFVNTSWDWKGYSQYRTSNGFTSW